MVAEGFAQVQYMYYVSSFKRFNKQSIFKYYQQLLSNKNQLKSSNVVLLLRVGPQTVVNICHS